MVFTSTVRLPSHPCSVPAVNAIGSPDEKLNKNNRNIFLLLKAEAMGFISSQKAKILISLALFMLADTGVLFKNYNS